MKRVPYCEYYVYLCSELLLFGCTTYTVVSVMRIAQFTYNLKTVLTALCCHVRSCCHFRFRMTIPSKQAYPIPPLGPNLGSKGSCITFRERERETKKSKNIKGCTASKAVRYWGVQPHFSPRHTEIWIWGWEKMGKKYMEREGKSIRFNKLLYIIINVFCILNKIFRVPLLGYDC